MIEPVRSARGFPRANAVCDECGRVECVPASHERRRAQGSEAVSEGQVVRKLTKQGWSMIKGKLRCPKCEARRKAHPSGETYQAVKEGAEAMSENVTQLRHPTPKQKRLIILALEDAYDDVRKRYKGDATDATTAADLGDGIMPGWVAEQREALFGPSGGNEEIEKISAEIKALRKHMDGEIAKLAKDRDERCAALSKRIDAVCAAVGPKAARC